MVMSLGVATLALIIASIVIKRAMKKRGIGKLPRFLVSLVFLIAILITLKYMLLPPVGNIPVTGKYQVQSDDYWLDEDVVDPYSESGQNRELWVRKWEPVDGKEDNPVIIASHGSCGTIDNNKTLYRELASYGYTVIAVAHPGQAASVTYKDGTGAGPSGIFMKEMSTMNPRKDPEGTLEVYKKWMDIRTTDLSVVMDDYASGHEGTTFVMLGHSLGGSAAYAMTRIRSDVVGCIALESPFMFDITGVEDGKFVFDDSDYNVPLLNIYSDSTYSHLKEWGEYGNNVTFMESSDPKYTNIYYKGVGHMGLCDLSYYSPILSNLFSGSIQKVNARIQLEILNRDCLDWLSSL